MSLFELFIVIIVCVLVIKPEDIPVFFKKIKRFRQILTDTRQEVLSYINPDTTSLHEPVELKEDLERINFYLERIASAGEEYEGDYSLASIKTYYKKIVSKKIEEERKQRE